MNAEVRKQLEATIVACAKEAEKSTTAIDALQYTQAALNASNALSNLHLNVNE